MLHLPSVDADPEPALRSAAFTWIRLIAQGHSQEAMAMLDEPNSYGELWDWKKVQEVVRDAFGHTGKPLVVTEPDTAIGRHRYDAIPFSDSSGYSVEMYLPLDGEWSDLTLQFEFLRRPAGLAMVLHDIHVL